MPIFKISIVNEHFSSSNEHDCPNEEAARKHAIAGALAIASEEVTAGREYFGAEVTLHLGKRQLARFVVSAGASPLQA